MRTEFVVLKEAGGLHADRVNVQGSAVKLSTYSSLCVSEAVQPLSVVLEIASGT